MNEIQKSDWHSQVDLVKSMVAKGASDEEFQLMCHMANKYSLDPLAKQIWLVKYRGSPASIFTGRDGFLSIGHRTGQFGGMETKVEKVQEPIDIKKIVWKDGKQVEIEVKRDWQYKATCTVRRKDAEFPFVSEVYEEEYTTCANLWTSKPRTMIGKVAESQCLRKAFDISGLYSPEEMPEPEKDVTPEKKPAPTARIKALPLDIQNGFAWLKEKEAPELPKEDYRSAVIVIMDANNDDPEALRGYLKDKGWQG